MIFMNNYAQFYVMISCSREIRKYHTGKEIKSIVKKCLSNIYSLDTIRRKQVEEFNRRYIQCKHPLMDDQLYYLRWIGKNNFQELKCFEKYEVVC